MIIQRHPLNKIYAHIGTSVFSDLVSLVGQERYTQRYLPLVNAYALLIQSSPLSKRGFCGAFGALSGALQSGILAIRLCDNTIFDPKSTAAQRMEHEPQYRYLVFSSVIATCYLTARGEISTYSGHTGELLSWMSLPNDEDWPIKASWTADKPQPIPLIQSHALLWLLFKPQWFDWIDPMLMRQWCLSVNPSLEQTSAETPMGKVVRVAVDTMMAHERKSESMAIGEGSGPAVLSGARTRKEVDITAPSNQDDVLTLASKRVSTAFTPPNEQSQSGMTSDYSDANQAAQGEPNTAPLSPQQEMAHEWLTALAVAALNPNHPIKLADHITWAAGDKTVKIGRKAMAFGTTPSKTLEMLHAAGVIHERVEDGVVLKFAAAQIMRRAQQERQKNT